MRKQCCKINCNPSGMRAPPARSDGSWRCGNGDENRVLLRVQIYTRTLYTYEQSAYARILTGEQSLACTRSLGVWKPHGIIHFSPKATLSVFRVLFALCFALRACVRASVHCAHACLYTRAHKTHTHAHDMTICCRYTNVHRRERAARNVCSKQRAASLDFVATMTNNPKCTQSDESDMNSYDRSIRVYANQL